MISYYCIASCDKCRAARKLLKEKRISHVEIDMRKDGIEAQTLENWIERLGVNKIVNQRSTTWRKLSNEEKESEIESLVLKNPTILHRPILDNGSQIFLGKAALDWLAQYPLND